MPCDCNLSLVDFHPLQEGAQIVGDQELEKTRAKTDEKATTPVSPKVKRQTTVGATVEVQKQLYLAYHSKLPFQASGTVLQDGKLGRTRAQTRKLSTSEDKPSMKRAGTMAVTAKVAYKLL